MIYYYRVIAISVLITAAISLYPFTGKASSSRVLEALAQYDETLQKMQADFSVISANPKDIHWVKLKIQHMWNIDQFSRSYLNIPYDQNFSSAETKKFQSLFWPKISAIDHQDAADIKELLKIYPWFRISIFGSKTDSNAWLLVQHADHDPEFQKSILKILESLYPIKETNPVNYAYMFDRVAASWGDPAKRTFQRYGTQGFCTGKGTWKPLPSEDEANLDVLRASVGLGTEAEYIEMFRDICKEDQSPH